MVDIGGTGRISLSDCKISLFGAETTGIQCSGYVDLNVLDTKVFSEAPANSATGIYAYGSCSPTVKNVTVSAGSADSSYGVRLSNQNSTTTILTDVIVSVSSNNKNYGVWLNNLFNRTVTLTNVTATAGGGASQNFAIFNQAVVGTGVTMQNIIATATGTGSSSNYAVYNLDNSSPKMRNVYAEARDGAWSRGVCNEQNSSPTMSDITASASGGTGGNHGLFNDSTSTPIVRHSSFYGETTGINGIYSGARIMETKIQGGVANDAGGTQCRDTYDENLNDVNC